MSEHEQSAGQTRRQRHGRTEFPLDDGVVTRHRATPQADVFIHALGSRGEPGQANYLLAQNLLTSLHGERVFTFDPDQFIDYSSQRPLVTLDRNRFVDYQPVEIAIDVLRDDEGRTVALLHGPEPDLGWEKFSRHVVEIVKEFDAELAIGVRSIPMTVPHTRPVHVIQHANREGLGADEEIVDGVAQWPASMASTIEYKLGQAGIDAIGFGAGIPFYIAQNPYPQAAAELIRKISDVSGLALPLGDLEVASLQVSAAISNELEGDARMEQMLGWMESQYDERSEAGAEQGQTSLADIPSADEIGAAAEAFLADFIREQSAREGERGREHFGELPSNGDQAADASEDAADVSEDTDASLRPDTDAGPRPDAEGEEPR